MHKRKNMTATAIKNYFSKLFKGEEKPKLPEGACPNCWGKQEYEGKFFELKKDRHFTQEGQRYASFTSKIVDEHVDKTHQHGDKYVCTACGNEF